MSKRKARGLCRETGKTKYATRRRAGMAGQTAKEERGHVTRAYVCPFCGAWHLTSKPKR